MDFKQDDFPRFIPDQRVRVADRWDATVIQQHELTGNVEVMLYESGAPVSITAVNPGMISITNKKTRAFVVTR